MFENPILGLDYPDVDVIRVEDTYYMISTTMYFMPGGVILRSYDLVNWEIVTYLYQTLEDTPAHSLSGEENIYGQGMWAASLRYHKGTFYVCFVANDTHMTYLYQSESIEGPWRRQYIEGFYHDASLFFDDDDRVYIIYGNSTIHLLELNSDLTGPMNDGLNRMIVQDVNHPSLGYEGTHFYKINGRYYVFFIHSLRNEWFRAQACFSSDTLLGEFVGGDVLVDDMNYRHSGVAQGGIVDTPNGDWYAILFQDRGAVGRIPVLVPMNWEEERPIFGIDGKVPVHIEGSSTRAGYEYSPLYSSDDFDYIPTADGRIELNKVWQWNHNPHNQLWSVSERKRALRLKSGKLCDNVTKAYNTLTQRTREPKSLVWVTVDGSKLKDGDFAGVVALQGSYAFVAITKEDEKYYITMRAKVKDIISEGNGEETKKEIVYEKVLVSSPIIKLKCSVDYSDSKDIAKFFYEKDNVWESIGVEHSLYFQLDHFTGCRFGLFYYSTKEIGGVSDFMDFNYKVED